MRGGEVPQFAAKTGPCACGLGLRASWQQKGKTLLMTFVVLSEEKEYWFLGETEAFLSS